MRWHSILFVMKPNSKVFFALVSCLITVGVLCNSGFVAAGELGHYMPGVASIRDFPMPSEPGLIYEQYNLFYTTDTYKDRNGNDADSVNIGSKTLKVDADIDTIHSYQGKVKMWSLLDFKVEQKTPGTHFLSKRIRREYDCNGAYIRTLAFKLYSWNMEQGKLVRSYNQPRNWKKIETNSMDEIEWKLACENH
jgi:hypothetical protein